MPWQTIVEALANLKSLFSETYALLYAAWKNFDLIQILGDTLAPNIFYDSLKALFRKTDKEGLPDNIEERIAELDKDMNKRHIEAMMQAIAPYIDNAVKDLPEKIEKRLRKSFFKQMNEIRIINKKTQPFINLNAKELST